MPPELIRWARAQVAALSADERALILAVAATLIAALTDELLDDLERAHHPRRSSRVDRDGERPALVLRRDPRLGHPQYHYREHGQVVHVEAMPNVVTAIAACMLDPVA